MADYILDVANETAKMDWAYSFQRTGAFPLDRSSLFSSYDDAVLYAQGGNDVRGLSGTSYVGQTVSVYNATENTVTLYIITADRNLQEVGCSILGDNVSTEIENGIIRLKNFGKGYYHYIPAHDDIAASYEFIENAFIEGLEPRIRLNQNNQFELAWYEPSTKENEIINNKIDNIVNDIENLNNALNDSNGIVNQINNLKATKADINSVYSKEDTHKAIAAAIANVDHLKRKVINSLDEIDLTAVDVLHYIYMVPTGLQYEDDKYDEYVVIELNDVDDETGETIVIKQIEKVGSWEVNLDNYFTKTEITNALAEKVDAQENARLITDDEIEKLLNIQANAQVNIIDSVSNDFSIDDLNKQLSLNNLSISKVTGLEELLNKKVDAKEGYTLLSPDDQEKLAALVIGDDNNLEISGSVNADNVKGLEEWLNKNAGNITGLSENNLTNELYVKLSNLLDITSVNPDEFTVSNKELNIAAVDVSKVTGLDEVLKLKANQVEFTELKSRVSGIEDDLNNFVLNSTYNADIQEIRDILTWQNI